MTDKLTIQFDVEIEPERLYYLIVTAIDGEIGYWSCVSETRHFTLFNLDNVENFDFTSPEAYFNVHERDDDGEYREYFRLDFDEFKSGLRVMAKKYPRHFADFINDNADGITSDVFIQCCCFGEIVYG